MIPGTMSSNIEYHVTKLDIIKAAFATINQFGEDETIPAADYDYASFMLNIMIKSWMSLNYQLWLKKICYLFPRLNQTDYSISSTSTDNFTLSYTQTTLTADANPSDATITVASSSSILINDKIGIMLSNNDSYWTIVSNKIGNVIYLSGTIPVLANSGSRVINYTSRSSNPLNVYQAVRSIDFITDVPMDYLSFQEYMDLPNKYSNPATTVAYQYDRQRENTIIRLWPTPSTANMLFKFVFSYKLTNVDVNSDEPDFPEEWFDAIVHHLAVKLCPRYGKNKDRGFENLKQSANEALDLALAFDNEVGSIYFRPDNRHG